MEKVRGSTWEVVEARASLSSKSALRADALTSLCLHRLATKCSALNVGHKFGESRVLHEHAMCITDTLME